MPLPCDDFIGKTAPNGVVIDEKMAEGAQVIVDNILETVHSFPNWQELLCNMLIEHRVSMPAVHPQNWGTLDAALWVPAQWTLYIWDYKHGHLQCDAEENLQLIDYVEGIREKLGINGQDAQKIKVVMRIVQPFCYTAHAPINEWVCQLSDLRGHVNNLSIKAHEAFTNPTLSSGKHCRYCPAVGVCSAARQSGYNTVRMVELPFEMDTMSVRDLAIERDILAEASELVKGRLKAIEADLEHRIGEGQSGSGLTLEATYGNLEWTCEAEQAKSLATQFGFDISKPGVKTPTQAKAAAPTALRLPFAEVLKTVTRKPPRGLKLIKAGTGRTARAFAKKS
jgi:hypothetical protein